MPVAQERVFQGREGTGAAQILGQAYDPLAAIRYNQQTQAVQDAAKAKAAEEAKKKRDDKIALYLNTDPEKTFQPFNDEVMTDAEGHRRKLVELFNKGGDPTSAGFQLYNKTGWDKVNDKARQGNYVKDVITEQRKMIEEDEFLDAKFYNRMINDQYLNPDGSGKKLADVDIEGIKNVVMSHPEGFLIDDYAAGFVDNLAENVFQYAKEKYLGYGMEIKDIETKIKGELFTPDENTLSGVKEDENGRPIINITKTVKNSFLSNPIAKARIQKEAAERGISEDLVLEEYIRDKAKHEKDQTTTVRTIPEWYGGGGNKDYTMATKRLYNIGQLQNAFIDEEGYFTDTPTEEAQRIIGDISQNAKYGNDPINDAILVKGTTVEGNNTYMGISYPNSKNDRILFKVETGNRGGKPQYSIREIDLTDPAAGSRLNAIYNTSESQGSSKQRNFNWDWLLDQNVKSDYQLYPTRKGKLRPGAKVDNPAERKQISEWQEEKNVDKMVGKYYQGKKILSVEMKNGPGFMGGLFAPKVFDIEVEGADGKSEFVEIKQDDYNSLSLIYNSSGSERQAPKPNYANLNL